MGHKVGRIFEKEDATVFEDLAVCALHGQELLEGIDKEGDEHVDRPHRKGRELGGHR